MSDPQIELSEARIRHLGMIQDTITRMATESTAMKRYALVSTAAVNSTAAATQTWYLALAGVVLVLVFWGMDAQYLTLERQYRGLFDKVRKATGPTDFSLTLPPEVRRDAHLSGAMFGWSLGWFYGALLGISVIITLVVAQLPETP